MAESNETTQEPSGNSSKSALGDLLECPFCGGEAHITRKQRGYRVECKKRFYGCHMNMRTHHCETSVEAINFWNTRKNTAIILKKIKEVLRENLKAWNYKDEQSMFDVYLELEKMGI